jgi:hypothetical protein
MTLQPERDHRHNAGPAAGRRAATVRPIRRARPQERDLSRSTRTAARTPEPGAVHELLKCVWSGYPDRGDRCHAHVPAGIAREAWTRELSLTHRTEGFFHFLWRDGRWLGYGMADGSVRGVYCATHCSERTARIVGEQPIRPAQQPPAAAAAAPSH